MSARPDVDPLAREQVEIERRRQRLEERRKRILDAKTRTKGVDMEGIQAQLDEKRAREQAERDREAREARELEAATAAVTALEISAARQARAEAEATRREQEQQEQERRARAKAEREEASALTNTSLDFAGEDLGYGERVKAQAAQQRGWATTQVLERQRREEADRRRREAEDAELLRVTKIAEDFERASHSSRAAHAAEVASQNLVLAQRKKDQAARDRELEQLKNRGEIEGQTSGAFLNEDKAVSRSAVNPNRVIPYAFKGFTAAERQKILDEQRAQIEERQRRMAEQAAQEEAEREEDLRVQRLMAREQRLAHEADQAHRRQIADEQARFAAEKREAEKHLNKDVYSNEVTEDFFAQFGTSTR